MIAAAGTRSRALAQRSLREHAFDVEVSVDQDDDEHNGWNSQTKFTGKPLLFTRGTLDRRSMRAGAVSRP
jgi:hypothetical protein